MIPLSQQSNDSEASHIRLHQTLGCLIQCTPSADAPQMSPSPFGQGARTEYHLSLYALFAHASHILRGTSSSCSPWTSTVVHNFQQRRWWKALVPRDLQNVPRRNPMHSSCNCPPHPLQSSAKINETTWIHSEILVFRLLNASYHCDENGTALIDSSNDIVSLTRG